MGYYSATTWNFEHTCAGICSTCGRGWANEATTSNWPTTAVSGAGYARTSRTPYQLDDPNPRWRWFDVFRRWLRPAVPVAEAPALWRDTPRRLFVAAAERRRQKRKAWIVRHA